VRRIRRVERRMVWNGVIFRLCMFSFSLFFRSVFPLSEEDNFWLR